MAEQETPLVLAIDAGGTAVKVALVAPDGRIVAQRHAAVETQHLADRRVERDAQAFWLATAQTIRALLTERTAGQLVAVGCTGFGNGIFLVDAEGRATRPGIVSVDHRAQPLVDRLAKQGRLPALSALNGNRLWGGQTVMQLAGLAEAEPAVMTATRWGLACKDFLRFCLTGVALTDPTDASGGGLMDMAWGGYSIPLLEALGRADLLEKLPPILPSSAVAGRVSAKAAAETGLPEGLPVAGGMMDVAACALGAGVTSDERMVMIAGTWAINAMEVTDTLPDRQPLLGMIHRDGAARLVAEGSPSSAANLGWYLDKAMGGRLTAAEAVAALDHSPVFARRCHFLPYVHGPKPRQGAFVGLAATDDTASMIRAICEGVAFQHRRHAEELLPHAGGNWPAAIRLTGGAARSPHWAQVFADVCNRPVEVVAAEEVGALGAAICAAVAGGIYPDLTKAAAAMSRIGRTHLPNPGHTAFYDDRYNEFQRLDRGMMDLCAGVP